MGLDRRFPSDQLVADAVAAGDREAFRSVVEDHAGVVIAACRRVLGDALEAEDVAQEAFVIAYRRIGTYRADGPLGAWVTRIAIRLAMRQARQRSRASLQSVFDADRLTAESALASDPAGVVIESERAGRVRAEVAALPSPYQEVVALRYFGDLSLEEIARTTSRPLGTVKTHLHRGLARLRNRLEQIEG